MHDVVSRWFRESLTGRWMADSDRAGNQLAFYMQPDTQAFCQDRGKTLRSDYGTLNREYAFHERLLRICTTFAREQKVGSSSARYNRGERKVSGLLPDGSANAARLQRDLA